MVAYELDRGLVPLLNEVLAGTDVEVREGNALEIDFDAALDGDDWHMIANLPYNIGTPLVLDVLRKYLSVSKLTIMLQAEVVDRLIAEPDTPDYGVPSIITAMHAKHVAVFGVPPQVFVPPPAVASSVIVLRGSLRRPWRKPAIHLARVAFGQRRKMLRRSLCRRVGRPECVSGGGRDRSNSPSRDSSAR